MTEKAKTIVVVAGLGKFYGAGRRLYLQLCELRPEIEPVLIDAQKLSEIAKQNGVNEKLFSPDIRGYGFWQWKPLLVHHYLNELKEGEVIYLDAGCDLEPLYFMQFLDWFKNGSFKLLLSHAGHNISKYTKPDIINELNKTGIDPQNTMMLQAGFLCLKANSKIKKVFQDAYELILSGRQDLFDDQINDSSKLPDYFIEHRHDQSVLTLLILNSLHIEEVGVLPTGLTPPQHLSWCPQSPPPLIATRNSSSVSLYWPLIKYRSTMEFPRPFRVQIKTMSKLAKLSGYNLIVLKILSKIISYQFKPLEIASKYSLEQVRLLRPPILMTNGEENENIQPLA